MVSSLNDEAVKVDVGQGVGWLTLNRPGQINAINDVIRAGVPAALARLSADDDVRVIVINGAGPRGFCAGADIKETRPVETIVETRERMARTPWFESLDRVSKPLIAAVHGVCMGGGLELALGCDIRIAARDAVFALPEVDLGLIPGGGGTQRLSRMIGLGRALDLILTGDRIDAEEAQRLGLVTRLSDSHESLVGDACALALRIAAKPPIALALAKEAVRTGFELDLRTGLRLERDLFAVVMSTEDRHEAAQAFRERRSPQFRGA